MRAWRARSSSSRRAWRMASPRSSCSSTGDVADAGVEPHGVVLDPDAVELTVEFAGVADPLQEWPLAHDMPEQALDPCLVGRGGRPTEPLGDGRRRARN